MGIGSWRRLFLACSVGLWAGAAGAQLAKVDLWVLPTTSPSDQEFLLGSPNAKPASIAAELRLPRGGSDRLPAVVMLHGSGGIVGAQDAWAREFAAMGLATLMIDSFSGRGIVSTVSDQDQLSRWAMIVDAYRALDRLSRHPRIDPARIALMGFSRGGGAAHYAALKRFAALYGPGDGMGFAAFVALYPTCDRVFRDGQSTVDKPIRLFHGTADDYIPIDSCRAYVDRMRRAGADIALTEYPGAHHVFDNPALKPPVRLAQGQTTRACPLIEETAEGVLVNSQTRRPFSYAGDACVERGVTVAYDAQAHAEVIKAVREFLATALKLK
ncbi:MAG: dienelactone hydrolase family protein [Burkholderiales bacterium]|nr:dienelactone hydrolase family protein [Burkholderiales bacterium]